MEANAWQKIPLHIDPIAFTVGFFSVYWYAVFLLIGISVAWLFLKRLERSRIFGKSNLPSFEDIFFFTLLGAFIGGKIGYILFYAGEEFLTDPLSFLVPYDFHRGLWVGLPGMSYHGAVIGGLLSLFFAARKKNFSFWAAADIVALAAPLLTFFGRLGNFFTGELPGRLTSMPWGMYVLGPTGRELRHPSALYEGLGEGLLLFVALLLLKKRYSVPGYLALFYLGAYSVIRFGLEFFREPDSNRGLFWGVLSQGQIFALFFLVGALLLMWNRSKKHAILSHVPPNQRSE